MVEEQPQAVEQEAKPIAQQAPPEPPKVVQKQEGCADWIAQAGIPLTPAVNTLIIKESGCRPDAVNPSSGACGIPQALPCSKLPCTLQDPVCQLKWMDNYVKERYTTWEDALAFHQCIGQCRSNYGVTYKSTTWY